MTKRVDIKKTLIETDYWDSEMAMCGVLQFSVTPGFIRILIPDSQVDMIPEMLGGKEIVLSHRPGPDGGKDSVVEILFDDHSDSPFSLLVDSKLWDRIPEPGSKWNIEVYARCEKILRKECYCRIREVSNPPGARALPEAGQRRGGCCLLGS